MKQNILILTVWLMIHMPILGWGEVYVDDFESGNITLWGKELCCEHSAEIVRSPVRNGQYAVKFRIEPGDPKVANGRRAEIKAHSVNMGSEYWYEFSIYVPDEWVSQPYWNIVAQWHGKPDKDLGEGSRSPPLALYVMGDNWRVRSRWSAQAVSPSQPPGTEIWETPLTRRVWVDWIFHIKWSYKDDGILEVWKDGVQIIEKEGPVCYNDALGPYLKIGLYCSPETNFPRVIYHDAVYHGDVPNSRIRPPYNLRITPSSAGTLFEKSFSSTGR